MTVMVMLILTGCIIAFLTPKAEYLPEGEESKAFSSAFAPPGYNIVEAAAIGSDIRDFLRPHVGADPADFDAGRSEFPPIPFFIQSIRPTQVRTIMPTVEPDHIDELIELLSGHLSGYPAMRSFVTRGSIFSGNSGGTRSINVDVSGPDIGRLYEASAAIFGEARVVFENPQGRADPSGLALAQPFLEIRPDWERAAELGITASNLGYSVSAYSDGAFVDEFFLDDDKIDMYLYSTGGTVEHPEDIANLYIYTEAGAAVPLSAVARVVETSSTDSIRPM